MVWPYMVYNNHNSCLCCGNGVWLDLSQLLFLCRRPQSKHRPSPLYGLDEGLLSLLATSMRKEKQPTTKGTCDGTWWGGSGWRNSATLQADMVGGGTVLHCRMTWWWGYSATLQADVVVGVQ